MRSVFQLFIAAVAIAAANEKAPAIKNPPPIAKRTHSEIKPSQAKPKTLDTVFVHKEYLDGDFDLAVEKLETALKSGETFSHSDSVFIFKHLGVMYTARYETREKGKQYMLRLLDVEPTARIMDMYASDMIYMIFKNIQEEFETSRVKLTHAEKNLKGNAQGDSLTGSSRSPESKQKVSEGHALIWIGTSVAIVAAGVTAYFVLNSTPSAKHVDASFQ